MAMLFPAPYGVVFILTANAENVKSLCEWEPLDNPAECGIIDMKRALPISGWLKMFTVLFVYRNRHLAEWRFLLFTVIVMV